MDELINEDDHGSSMEEDGWDSNGPPIQNIVTPFSSPCPTLEPSWEEIAKDGRGTLVHVPRGAQATVQQTFLTLLRHFRSNPGWQSLHALWAFPKCVLVPLKRRGKNHWAATGRKVKNRAQLYLSRPVRQSWMEAALPAPTNRPNTRRRTVEAEDERLERLLSRMEGLVGHGALGKGSRLLMSDGVQDPEDPVVLQTLRDLHPSCGAPGYLVGTDSMETLIVDYSREATQDRIVASWKAVFSFPKDSAAVPSGLRPDHLNDLVADPAGTLGKDILEELDSLIMDWLVHGIPTSAATILRKVEGWQDNVAGGRCSTDG